MTSADTTTSNSTIPVEETHEHSHTCNDPTHHHDMPSFLDEHDLFSSKPETNVKRTVKKKKPQQNAVRAETIPGHRGGQNIDDLMSFINGPSTATTTTNDKKSKKKSTN